MSSSDSAKAQARVLLQALCKFVVPAIQTALWQNRMDVEQVSSGAEADELLIELEKFISGILSCSQSRTKDLAIVTALDTPPNHYSEDVPAPAIPFEHNNNYAIARPIKDPEVDRKVRERLQNLRKVVNQKMPIRLLCFEPHTDNSMKITLLGRNEIYNYLASKVSTESGSDWMMHARYAILSHTWTQTPGELTYGDWQKGSLVGHHPKSQKLVNFCKVAWKKHQVTLGWIDTVCINKESSTELDESIRSMYAWYCNASVCIAYLSETNILSDIRNDPWFTRGWTFQELVAPARIKFYNKDWNRFATSESFGSDDKDDWIQQEITLATTITREELADIRSASISRRMQLAAQRQVTREEDIAYCLMGIFDVSISTAYGEGAKRAFFRLVEEIFRSTKDVSDILNWAGDHEHSGWQPTTSLFPSHPSNYLNRVDLRSWRLIEPLTLTHLGLRTPILLMPAVPIRESAQWICQPIGDYYATISIIPFRDNQGFEIPQHYHLSDKRFFGPERFHEATFKWWKKRSTLSFGILNVEEQGTSIHIPKICLAVLLQLTVDLEADGNTVSNTSPSYSRIYTEKSIVFHLQKTDNFFNNVVDKDEHYYKLERSELAKHGMELVTLYL